MTNLATVLHQLGDDNQAMELATKGLALRRARFGDEHIDVWNSLINIAALQEASDDLPGAKESRREAMQIASKSSMKRIARPCKAWRTGARFG